MLNTALSPIWINIQGLQKLPLKCRNSRESFVFPVHDLAPAQWNVINVSLVFSFFLLILSFLSILVCFSFIVNNVCGSPAWTPVLHWWFGVATKAPFRQPLNAGVCGRQLPSGSISWPLLLLNSFLPPPPQEGQDALMVRETSSAVWVWGKHVSCWS